MKCLLLGGTHDGEWIDVNPGVESVRLFVRKPFTPSYQDITDETGVNIQQEIYYESPVRTHEINGNTTAFPIYTCPAMSTTKIIHHLMSGYKKGGALG